MDTNDHLSASQLAGYLDRDLRAPERRVIEEHLDGCAECRAEVTALVRMGLPGTLAPPKARSRPLAVLAWLVPLAAGLGVFMVSRPARRLDPGLTERPSTGPAESVSRLRPIAPGPGATVAGTAVVFSWHGHGADTYRVVVMTEAGEPVWSEETSDTVVPLPASVHLARGAAYFWRVESIADGVTATSAVQRLIVAP